MRLFAALIGLAAVLTLAACASIEDAEPPEVRLADLRILEGGLIEQRFQVDLTIGNPNDFDLPVDGLTFELELNDRPFAQGFSNESVTVPRLGEARVPVVASTTLLELVQQALALGQRSELSYRIEGQVYLRGLRTRAVPYERSGRMRLLPETPDERTLVPL